MAKYYSFGNFLVILRGSIARKPPSLLIYPKTGVHQHPSCFPAFSSEANQTSRLADCGQSSGQSFPLSRLAVCDSLAACRQSRRTNVAERLSSRGIQPDSQNNKCISQSVYKLGCLANCYFTNGIQSKCVIAKKKFL
ncbi:hypothetical protein PCH_Pc20g14120 [Penicillium rubens Wisconsin 54-1255]|uniref:Uncharacterized protein n=1 Tax=Penicillium rubens (strain ATCC 28089 / DSM 1075 / NRRL 1951 / Wisconsin 54-1255) TaxID=500485 RepID=B6HH98_PENRW|nr:hypothetical protein PCH_Pc20g14120 [Penicillium rubens Wisconsin 54-1255]